MSELSNVFQNIANSVRNTFGILNVMKPVNMASDINNFTGALPTYVNYDLPSQEGVPYGYFPFGGMNTTSGLTNYNTVNYLSTGSSYSYSNLTNLANYFNGGANQGNQWQSLFQKAMVICPNVINTADMFSRSNFNANVIVYTKNVLKMFEGATFFNRAVNIPQGTLNTQWMFNGCINFNSVVNIPDSVENTAMMFANCYNFNQPVTIPKNATDIVYMFANCYNFNQPVTIPKNITNLYGTFWNCNTYNTDIYVDSVSIANVANMFRTAVNTSAVTSRNIWFNNSLNSIFNRTSTTSIVGTTIYWTAMSDGNGFYNTSYRINCYNNYVPTWMR